MRNKKKGFTIVELVIVIAVIGILSAILIPTFANLTNKANEVKLQEELRNSYVAYASEYDENSEELLADTEVIIVKEGLTLDANDQVTFAAESGAYKLNAETSKWVEVTTGTYTLEKVGAAAKTYNGYHIYKVTAVA